MPIYGYARASTVEQVAGLADQISKLKGAIHAIMIHLNRQGCVGRFDDGRVAGLGGQ